MIYRIVSNGAIFRVQFTFRFWPFWFNHVDGDFALMNIAEAFVAHQLKKDRAAGRGTWMTMAVYDPYEGSDRGDSPTNAERLMRESK